MADLDALRPEIREAVEVMDARVSHATWQPIRAELLRLAAIEADALIALDCEHDWQVEHERAEKAEAELVTLRATIAESPVYEIPLSKPKSEDGWARVIESVRNERSVRGKRVRLLVDEPAPSPEPGSLDELRIERGGGNHG